MTGKVDSGFLCRDGRGEKCNFSGCIFADTKCEPGTLGSAKRGPTNGNKGTFTLRGTYWGTLGSVWSGIDICMVSAFGSGSVACLKISAKWKRAWR